MLKQLLLKELRLQRSCLFFVLAVVVMWGVLLLLPQKGDMASVDRLLEYIVVGVSLLLIAPLFVGATLVAEERQMGTWDWQLSLPAPRLLQWVIKIAVGSAIVLLLAFVLQPFLDSVLASLLSGEGGLGQELPSDLRHDNPTYLWLPLLEMAAAAFISSVSRDSYKAFFGGGVVAALVVLCTRLADPADLLFGLRFLYWDYRFVCVLGFCAILLSMGWRNFRFETPGWGRFVVQTLGVFLLVLLTTDLFLRGQFTAFGFLTTDKKAAAQTIKSQHIHEKRDRTPLDWTGIEPLLVKRYPQGLTIGMDWQAEYWTRDPFGRVYRLPGTDRLVVEANTFPGVRARVEPPADKPHPETFEMAELFRKATEMNYQILEVDVASGRVTNRYQVAGYVKQGLPNYSAYTVEAPDYNDYLVSGWPTPIQVGGPFWRIWTRGKKVDLASPGLLWDPDFHEFPWGKIHPVTSDFKWFIDPWEGVPTTFNEWMERNPPHEERRTVRAREGGAFWTIKNPSGQLVLWPGIEFRHPAPPYMFSKGLKATASEGPCIMPVSNQSGRFLPFVSTDTTKVAGVNGELQDVGFPELVRLCLLDLETGEESVLIELPPDHGTLEEWKGGTDSWAEWIKKIAVAQSATQPAISVCRVGPGFRVFRQPYPPLAWAPQEDKLAFVYDGKLRLFRAGGAGEGQSAKETGKESGEEKRTKFMPAGVVDVAGSGIDTLAFWGDDNNTLLAWGKVGLFKIDLEKATRPRPSAEPAR